MFQHGGIATLPRDYARRGIAPEKMNGLIDLIADIGFKATASARATRSAASTSTSTENPQ